MNKKFTSESLALTPRLKIFLSADIVGSTAYKQRFEIGQDSPTPESIEKSITNSNLWQKAIQNFYRDIVGELDKVWNKQESIIKTDYGDEVAAITVGEKPHFWKTIGDEVVFWKEIGHEHQTWFTIIRWMEVISHIRNEFKKNNLSLNVKSTIWAAEFPVRNRVLYMGISSDSEKSKDAEDTLAVSSDEYSTDPIPMISKYYEEPNQRSRTVDFIGPGIDVGFRLSQFSSLKRMAVSIDVSYLMALSYLSIHDNGTWPTGFHYTKSVFNGDVNINSDIKAKIIEIYNKLLPPSTFAIAKKGKVKGEIKINYSGTEYLKGVLGGIKYPILWINSVPNNSMEALKDALYIDDVDSRGLDWLKLFNFCWVFYKDRSQYIHPPFVNADPNMTLTNVTPGYEECLDLLRSSQSQ